MARPADRDICISTGESGPALADRRNGRDEDESRERICLNNVSRPLGQKKNKRGFTSRKEIGSDPRSMVEFGSMAMCSDHGEREAYNGTGSVYVIDQTQSIIEKQSCTKGDSVCWNERSV